MKKVMAFGCFSLIHPGHLLYLEEAKNCGDHLTVVITTDRNYRKRKKREPVFNAEERKILLQALKSVDKVVIGHEEDFLKVVKEEKPDLLALGYDDIYVNEKELEKLTGIKTIRIEKSTKHKTKEIVNKIMGEDKWEK